MAWPVKVIVWTECLETTICMYHNGFGSMRSSQWLLGPSSYEIRAVFCQSIPEMYTVVALSCMLQLGLS